MRLFVSVDLPAPLEAAVSDAQDRFRPADCLRFVDPSQAHLTLKFLGDVGADRLPAVEAAIESAVTAANVAPFELTVSGFGVFPSLDYISVVWAGVDDGGRELTRLHEAIEREATAVGFDPERHEFTPHITLARMDDARDKETVRRVVADASPTLGAFRVEQIRLKESALGPDGPTYGTVRRFDLSEPS
ncbi:RNA 2',3'-cyclic phosphodiesterase [Haloferacaceae archaeon DSL9]